MNAETELLWLGAALLLLLGAVASLCVRCSHPGAKRSEKIYEQRNLQENQQNFAVARTYSLAGQAWPGVLMDTAADMEPARKDKLLQFSPSLEDSASPRYQNFSKGSRHGSDAAYIDPIAMDYCNWGQVPKSQEVHSGGDLGGQRRCPGWCLMEPDDDDDTNSYENVLICKPEPLESGDGGSEDYQNSASIQQWRESKRLMERVQKEAPSSPAGSPDEDDDGEPDYVNGEVAATEA